MAADEQDAATWAVRNRGTIPDIAIAFRYWYHVNGRTDGYATAYEVFRIACGAEES